MSRKRRNSSSVEPESPSSVSMDHNERNHVNEYPSGNQRPLVDQSTGQTGAFPGLTEDDQMFYGPAADGVDYLRMVRSERKNIPSLLTANHTAGAIYDELKDEDGGYYTDGAYTAGPRHDEVTNDPIGRAQTYYYDSLLAHFRLIRATMRCIPPLKVIEDLDSSRPISFPTQSKQARRLWESQLSDTAPHPVQVACMDSDSVLQLVALLTKKLIVLFNFDNVDRIERLGAWIWAVLGKCPDRGELSSEDISDIRSLAVRASDILKRLSLQPDTSAVDLDMSDDSEAEPSGGPATDDKTNDIVSDPTQRADTGVQCDAAVQARQAAEMKMVILDAIITVVGEIYGQRDLLESRRVWVKNNIV